jgi:LPXTG-motif cell wall-anchored protein
MPVDNHRDYPASVATTTDLTLERSTVQPGQSNTARATVTAEKGEQPRGTVTFKVAGRPSSTVPLLNGTATYEMPTDLKAGRTYKVTARYNGKGVWKPSMDTAYVTVTDDDTVAGEEGSRDGEGGANRPGTGGDGEVQGVDESEGALPSVGSEENTLLYTLLGLGLLGAGAFTLLMLRRRAQG